MPRARIVRADESLTHQIRLDFVSGRNHITSVKCNCRGDEPLGQISNAGDPWPIYNDPTKHDNSKEQFVPRARHSANQEVYFVD